MNVYEVNEAMARPSKPNANDSQVGGSHYKNKAIQPWDFIIANNIGFLDGNAITYLTRWQEKGGIDDLKKAIHFIEKLIEVEHNKMKDKF